MTGRRCALDTRIATIALALVLAAISLPTVSGWVVADSRCAITMDICHAAQAADVSHAPLLATAPQLFSMSYPSGDALRAIGDGYRANTGRLSEAPDPPPPKRLE